MNKFYDIPDNPKVVFVRPPINRWKLYNLYAPFGSREPALGLLYIASYIKSKGYETYILDGELLGGRELVNRIRMLSPDVIGITSTTFSFFIASEIANEFRKILPKSLILLGGYHVSALPNESLIKARGADGIVIGEGEETFVEVLKKHETKEIAGLAWIEQPGCFLRVNNPRIAVNNLDKYELNWNLLEDFPNRYLPPFQSRKKNSTALVVSRGCYYNCSFCSSIQMWGKRVRFHTPAYVVNMMIELKKKYGIDDFYFHDDYFSSIPKWTIEFCKKLVESGESFSWSCASRVESLNIKILQIMKNAGCRQIGVGVESGSQSVLDTICKDISIEKLSEGLKTIESSGIRVKGYFILGIPNETIRDLLKTIKIIFTNKFSHIQFNYYTPLPGSRDYNKYKVSEMMWNLMSLQKCLGYSGINAIVYKIVEISLYFILYIKNSIVKIYYELFNRRSELSS